jgi:hypothetical protein
VRIPVAAVERGAAEVASVASVAVRSFESLLRHPGIQDLMVLE